MLSRFSIHNTTFDIAEKADTDIKTLQVCCETWDYVYYLCLDQNYDGVCDIRVESNRYTFMASWKDYMMYIEITSVEAGIAEVFLRHQIRRNGKIQEIIRKY